MNLKSRTKKIRLARIRINSLRIQQGMIYADLLAKLGIDDNSSALFDYLHNGYGRVRDVAKETMSHER